MLLQLTSPILKFGSTHCHSIQVTLTTRRWKILPRVALLACTLLAEMVNISQFVSSSMTGPSPATTALSAILFFGIMLLLVMLPVAFFRVKIQDARRRAKFRKVHTSACLPYLWTLPRDRKGAGGGNSEENVGAAKRNGRHSTACAARRGWVDVRCHGKVHHGADTGWKAWYRRVQHGGPGRQGDWQPAEILDITRELRQSMESRTAATAAPRTSRTMSHGVQVIFVGWAPALLEGAAVL